MLTEYERVRKQIAKKYCGSSQKIGVILADRILALAGIEIRADDQSLPLLSAASLPEGLQMAGFVKVIPKPLNVNKEK